MACVQDELRSYEVGLDGGQTAVLGNLTVSLLTSKVKITAPESCQGQPQIWKFFQKLGCREANL